MQDSINKLIDQTQPFIFVIFENEKGEKHSFYNGVNKLTGQRLQAFDNNAPSVNVTIQDGKTVLKNIQKKENVLTLLQK